MPPFQAVRELIRRVQSDCAVEVDGNAYSVPWRLIGSMVRVTLMDGCVRVHHGSDEVAVHSVAAGRRHRVTDPAHLQGLIGVRRQAPATPSATLEPALLRPLGEYEAIAGGSF